ncbi:MAG: hypothetical protein R2942_12560 [Ignavibacteria bacterium]
MAFTGADLESFYPPSGSAPGQNLEPKSIILEDFELPTSFSLS